MTKKKDGWNTPKQFRKFVITIDRKIMEEYEKYYFKNNPNKKKFYLKSNWKGKRKNPTYLYCTPSLNQILPMDSRFYKTLKDQWGMFGMYLAKRYSLEKLYVENCVVEFVCYKETKAHADVDNMIGGSKLVSDCLFSESKFMEDDNSKYVNLVIGSLEYDKEHPRMEIRVSECGDLKTKKERLDLHFKNFED